MSKLATASVGFSVIIFTVLIPVLEVSPTHVFNPEWPSHARLHIAWQLLTNAALSILALGCVWSARSPRIGICIALITVVSFLTAFTLRFVYGGSMLHTDGTQIAVGGINVAVIIMIPLTALLLASLWKTKAPAQKHGV